MLKFSCRVAFTHEVLERSAEAIGHVIVPIFRLVFRFPTHVDSLSQFGVPSRKAEDSPTYMHAPPRLRSALNRL